MPDATPTEPPIPARERIEKAGVLMAAFADRTGLDSTRENRRYLWTDAFAVRNFLGLARATGDAHYTELALRLVDRVHHTLGRHRADDVRQGWISGLSEAEGEAHPTRGGIRIGKELPERTAGAPLDESLEWDRDGQYFHYLTRWMRALDEVARAMDKPVYNAWARELADAAYRGFVRGAGSAQPRMVWKMSIDLSRPVVGSMGQHDPLDGLLTFSELIHTARQMSTEPAVGPDLTKAIADFRAMVQGQDLATLDPLGIGGLLEDAARAEEIGPAQRLERDLRDRLLGAALIGLEGLAPDARIDGPAEHRLAFRELGLGIGLRAAELMHSRSGVGDRVARFQPLAWRVVLFWLEPVHQRAGSWLEHRDINEVMLATALLPAR